MPRHLYTRDSLVSYRSFVKQLSGRPALNRSDKNMNFLCTAASFTMTIRSRGFVVLCQLTSSFRLILCPCSSARKFASGYSDRDRWLKCRFCRSKNLPDQTSRSSPCHSLVVTSNNVRLNKRCSSYQGLSPH